MVNAEIILNSILLGIGLAMDAFSVSVADGLSMPDMKKGQMVRIAGIFAFFQFAMPLIGWACVYFLQEKFVRFSRFIPYIAPGLLFFVGIKMIIDAVKSMKEDDTKNETDGAGDKGRVRLSVLLLQALATSLDALSVGFTIAAYKAGTAVLSSGIIGVETFAICMSGLLLGGKIGIKFAKKAGIFGGIILILIGLKIFTEGVFFS